MKSVVRYLAIILLIGAGGLSSAFLVNSQPAVKEIIFPYKKAGLTERQAAAHLLSRFTYGATPGQIDELVKTGLEKWFIQQLDGNAPDDSLNRMLNRFDALGLSNQEIVAQYPKNAAVLRMAVRDGIINKDSVKTDRKEYRAVLQNYMQQKGYQPQQELLRQLANQKVLRAGYSKNQLHEVLTDFWFNHFNVSVTKNDCAQFVLPYERDVIRPNVTGKFGNLLLATAQSPAMLYFLDNFSSTGTNAQPATRPLMNNMANPQAMKVLQKVKGAKKARGLNENYAREVMELHTLGVDGGYTQHDVTEAARILTGWTVFPMDAYGNTDAVQRILANVGEDGLKQRGFVHHGDFLFTPNRHDDGSKVVLGKMFDANGGYREGVELLQMLAHHPSTAKFITKKIAVRFVSDNPPQSLLDKMAGTFMETDGNIRQVLITMVSAPEFWSVSALREKTKSPFELVISSARALNARINQPYQLYNWTNKMGQRLYGYQAPTGFPDRGQYWINTGALLNRMNFGLAIAANRIPGVRVDLAALNNHHEPESAGAALVTYGKILMPGRDLTKAVAQLKPMLGEQDLAERVKRAADKAAPDTLSQKAGMITTDNAPIDKKPVQINNDMLAQVVGIIIGSPEFQRR